MIDYLKNIKNYPIWIAFQILSLLAVVVCGFQNYFDYKSIIYTLPLAYFFINAFSFYNYLTYKNYVSFYIIQSIYFVRLVLTPFLYSFNYQIQLYEGSIDLQNNYVKAIVLMIYEFTIIQLMLYLFRNNIRKEVKRICISISNKIDFTSFLIVLLFLITVILLLISPGSIRDFKTILELGDADFTVASSDVSKNSSISTLFSFCFQIDRVLVPALIISYFHRKNGYYITAFVTIIFCLIQFFYLTSTFAEAIVSCFTIILFFMFLNPGKDRSTYIMLAAFSIGIITLYFSVRYFVPSKNSLYIKDEGPLVYAAHILNAYFSGIENVAAIFNVPGDIKTEALQSDLKGAIPFNSHIFAQRGNKLQFFYNLYNRSYGQIPPTIAAGYYYFGWIFSPIVSAVFAYLSLLINKISKSSSFSLDNIAYSLAYIVFALGCGMYSPAITLSWFFGWCVPVYLITCFSPAKLRK